MDATIDTTLMQALDGACVMESACSADTVTLYKLEQCLWAGKTPSCDKVVIGKNPVYGTMLFLDDELQSAQSDEAIYHEHLIHPALAAAVAAKKTGNSVLVVGGGEGATVREVLKWGDAVDRVDWIDIDSALVDLCRHHMKFAEDDVYNDRRVRYLSMDIRAFLMQTDPDTKYDVIVLDLPDPDVAELRAAAPTDANPLYGPAFWALLKGCLADSGVVVSHAGPVAPGDASRRAGLEWICASANMNGIPMNWMYQTFIPSFQSMWGFVMSRPPVLDAPNFPSAGLSIMDADVQKYAFTRLPYMYR